MKEAKGRYGYFRYALIPLEFIGFYFLGFFIGSRKWVDFIDRPPLDILLEILYVVFFCILITEVSLTLARMLDKAMPWHTKSLMRSVIQFVSQILLTVIFVYGYMHLALFIFGGGEYENLEPNAIKDSFVVAIILSLFVSTIQTGDYLLLQWRRAREESSLLISRTSELKQIAMEAELQALKMQLDPHFLFNNFSTLSALIGQDEDKAQLFLQKLSNVYRYMILNINKNLISVEDELEFANAYFYLMKIRFGENMTLEIDLNENVKEKFIPPITLQLLIENAIKHNVASLKYPLLIRISQESDQTIVVCNTLKRLNYTVNSTSTGLKNVFKRYKLLSERIPEISENQDLFVVKIPLIDPNEF